MADKTFFKILDFEYEIDNNLIKMHVEKEDNSNETWGLTGESFDSLVAQITKKQLSYTPEQRKQLFDVLKEKSFNFEIQYDNSEKDFEHIIDREKGEDDPEKNFNSLEFTKMQKLHTAMDLHPFYEIQKSIMEKNNNG